MCATLNQLAPPAPQPQPQEEKESSLAVTLTGKGGSTEGFTPVGGASIAIEGKIGNAIDASSAIIDIAGGNPVLRIKGSAELFPINLMKPQLVDFGLDMPTMFKILFKPVNIDGRLTVKDFQPLLDKKAPTLGRSSIVMTPDVAAQLIHLDPKAGIVAAVSVRAGFAGGYAKDGDGQAVIAGASAGGGGEIIIIITSRHMISAGGGAKVIPSFFKTMGKDNGHELFGG